MRLAPAKRFAKMPCDPGAKADTKAQGTSGNGPREKAGTNPPKKKSGGKREAFRKEQKRRRGPRKKRRPLATYKELADFLAEVERRAFKQALFAVRDEETALDIVQDAMLRLTERYAGRPPAELPLLFQRILQNAIRDFYRRHKVRSLWSLRATSGETGTISERSGDEIVTFDAAGKIILVEVFDR